MANRLEGQIWIDQKAPHNLKYYVGGKEYAIDTSVVYNGASVEVNCSKGTLLAINSEGKACPAVYPTHINSVIGVCTEDLTVNEETTDSSIINEGYLEVSKSNLPSAAVGKKVYWDLTTTEGFNLTLNTPDSNIVYYNLPVVGIITKVTDNDVEIHLNFSNFTDTISWKAVASSQYNEESQVHECSIDSKLLKDKCFTSDIKVFYKGSPIICKTLVEEGINKIILTKELKDLTVYGTVSIEG